MSAACRSSVRDLLPWYLNGTLEGVEAGAVRDHLAACAACTAELDALGEIADLVRVHGVPIAARARSAEWPAAVPSPAGSRHPRRRRLTWASGIAAMLALVGILGFFRFQALNPIPPRAATPVDGTTGAATLPAEPPAAPTPAVVMARLDLGAGPTRGEGDLPVLRIPAGAEQVEVTFVVPGGGDRGSVRIEDAAQRPVTVPIPVTAHDPLGRSTSVFPVTAFRSPGEYALVLSQHEEVGGMETGTRAEYRYPFRFAGRAENAHLQSPAATNAAQ